MEDICMADIFELFSSLLSVAAPSGFESETAERIKELAHPFADEIQSDVMGNVIVHKKGTGKKIMFSAHMDAIGFMVSGIDENGFLSISPIGYHVASFLPGTPVRFQNGLKGNIYIRSSKIAEDKKIKEMTLSDLYVDIGASDKDEAACDIGSVCVFDLPARQLLGGRISGPYMDDLIGCVVLLLALEQLKDCIDITNDLYFVFSSQEEVGLRGALTAAYAIEPDLGVTVDIFPALDTPATKPAEISSALGAGPGVIIKDGAYIATSWVFKHILGLAKKHAIAHQPVMLEVGGSDSGAIQKARSGVPVGGIGLPTRYAHSPVETVDIRDIEAAVQLATIIAMSDLI
jgi:endoglucanase